MFDGGSCPQLSKKPKIFFFQACQGKTETKGVSVDDTDSVMECGLNKLSVVDSPNAKPLPTDETVHEKNDTIVAYSTVPGYIAMRHKYEGSWFINDLVDTFSEHACNNDILQLLVKVNDKVSRRRTKDGILQAIQTVQSLRKSLYFFPGYAVNR
ncbi:hypothetical protein NP493_1981g00017 [Ridgeia piscesae]|uniref:Uncharacterized protein n=1 Tax=Ridgeia piscesae TaxID=27915 RepID=A0AAD9JP63_RIDPI|nr:hypothetical protein NP493_1981g00017 [Ridgeia piscesae]